MNRLQAIMLFLAAVLAACGEGAGERAQRRQREQMDAAYASSRVSACAAGARSGAAGYSETLRSDKGVPVTVVTPRNYDATLPHPLLIVFAPAGIDRFEVERVTAFTGPATRAGFIVAYANHPALGVETTKDLGSIGKVVAKSWCVDESRLFYAGHSDGATVSHILSVLPVTRDRAVAIAPSGAGVTAEDLQAYGCPAPMAVIITHARNDERFPGWGEATARWWAACNRCDVTRVQTSAGCIVYQGCDPHGPTLFCASEGSHAHWPGNAQRIMDFFLKTPLR